MEDHGWIEVHFYGIVIPHPDFQHDRNNIRRPRMIGVLVRYVVAKIQELEHVALLAKFMTEFGPGASESARPFFPGC